MLGTPVQIRQSSSFLWPGVLFASEIDLFFFLPTLVLERSAKAQVNHLMAFHVRQTILLVVGQSKTVMVGQYRTC